MTPPSLEGADGLEGTRKRENGEAIMTLTLREEERALLLETLERYRHDLVWLISKTDSRECKVALRQDAAIIDGLLDRLRSGGLAAEPEFVHA